MIINYNNYNDNYYNRMLEIFIKSFILLLIAYSLLVLPNNYPYIYRIIEIAELTYIIELLKTTGLSTLKIMLILLVISIISCSISQKN